MTDKPVSERATVKVLEYFMLTLPAIHCSPGICRTCRDWIEREYRKLADRAEEAERQAKQWADATEFQGLRAERAEREVASYEGMDRAVDHYQGKIRRLERELEEARDNALEEAAKICDNAGTIIFAEYMRRSHGSDTALKIGAAIRALKSKP